MKNTQKLVNAIIFSLENEHEDWIFGKHTAVNLKWGIDLWIANVPVLNLQVFAPTEFKFNLWDKIRVYMALRECRALFLLNKKNK